MSTLRKSQILVRRSHATSISASTQAKTCERVESVQITVNGSTQRLIQQDDLGGCASIDSTRRRADCVVELTESALRPVQL